VPFQQTQKISLFRLTVRRDGRRWERFLMFLRSFNRINQKYIKLSLLEKGAG
jgi:hypothetical protein